MLYSARMGRLARLAYRLRQFRLALPGGWRRVPDEALSPYLSPALITLFRRMQPSEQAHSFSVLERLRAAGQADPDLLAAALLHDTGKMLLPLSVWDRALAVLGWRFLPRLSQRWAETDGKGLHRPFVVATRHPEWGARLVAAAGASPRTVELVRRHQDAHPGGDALLAALQQADGLE